MKKVIFCAAFLFCLHCLVPSQANAQQTFGYSQVGYDDITNTVYGSSTTIVDYIGAFHYRAYVEGYLYDQSGNLLDSGYDEGYFIAEVLTIAPAFPVTQYTLYSDHYVVARFFTTVDIRECDPYCYYCFDYFLDPYCDYYCYSCSENNWWDPFGFSFGYPGDYGPWWYFYGSGPPASLEVEYIYLGSTSDSLITPTPQSPQCPNLSIRLIASFGSNPGALVEGTTQNGFLGAVVGLEADIVPSVVGSYSWRTAGNAHQNTTPEGDITNIYWLDEGTHSVVVTFTPSNGGCQVSGFVNVNEVVPSVYTFSGSEQAPRVRADCASGINGFGGTAVSLGCGIEDAGITFAATTHGPSTFISSPSDSGIKFVQWVSAFAFAHSPSDGYQCNTRRTTEALVDTGWFRDGFDPYNLEQSFSRFNAGGSASLGGLARPDTTGTGDSPGYGLGSFDYFRNDDRFERYLVYFAGDARDPIVRRDIAVIYWNWSSEIFFSSPGVWSSYAAYPPNMLLQPSSPTVIRVYNPGDPVSDSGWGPCPGGNPSPTPTPTPPPDDSFLCLRKPWLCD